MKTKIVQNIKSVILALVLVVGVSYVSAYSTWVGPTATAPGNNTDTPLDVSNRGQIKQGNLLIKGITSSGAAVTNGLIVENGRVGIGTTAPGVKLDVVGTIRTTGLQLETGAGAGKVLTSNATGGATWQVAGVSSSNAYSASNGSTTNMGVHNFCVLSTVNNDQDGSWMGCAVSGDVNKAWSLRSIGAGSAVCRAMCFD